MGPTNQPGRLRPAATSLLDALRQFLTPAVYRQAHQARAVARPPARWSTQPLLLTLLVLTWCCGDSLPERFETARAFCVACLPKRRRPGATVQGFQKALACLPMAALRAVAAAVRTRLAATVDLLSGDGFAVFGGDGSRLECPRSAELESRLGKVSRPGAAPCLWVTALVHLRTGLLWSWWLGKGDAAEREHLRALLTTLPPQALLVADAGFNGYDLARAIVARGASFLIRMSGKVGLYLDGPAPGKDFTEGLIYCWPKVAQEKKLPPLRCRLIRVRGKKGRDVWLLTDVVDGRRLPRERAARYYRWRWENEGLFRTYKRTLAKVKLLSRTVRLVHREAEGSLLATQLLLAWGARAVAGRRGQRWPQRCSPRHVLLAVRQELSGRPGRRRSFGRRLAQARRERRPGRRSGKVKREWPRREAHKPLKPPQFLTLTAAQKSLLAKVEGNSG
jgi:Transposase DDE domain